MMEIIAWFQTNGKDLVLIYTGLVTVASIVVKMTPTLKDDDALKSIIKFIGKFIALNR
jgi:hypothetical protein